MHQSSVTLYPLARGLILFKNIILIYIYYLYIKNIYINLLNLGKWCPPQLTHRERKAWGSQFSPSSLWVLGFIAKLVLEGLTCLSDSLALLRGLWREQLIHPQLGRGLLLTRVCLSHLLWHKWSEHAVYQTILTLKHACVFSVSLPHCLASHLCKNSLS